MTKQCKLRSGHELALNKRNSAPYRWVPRGLGYAIAAGYLDELVDPDGTIAICHPAKAASPTTNAGLRDLASQQIRPQPTDA